MLGVVEPHPDLDGVALANPVEDVLHGHEGDVVRVETDSKITWQKKKISHELTNNEKLQRLSSFILFHPHTL